jgi:predicted HicB family RNase H-like nuclease
MLRIAPEIHAAALKAAARSGTSLNKWAEATLGKAAGNSLACANVQGSV